jgi:uncharacterized membrane protein (DUF106 family)
MVLNAIFNTIFGPILGLSYFLIILIVSLILTLITTLIYKWTTDQKRMKALKVEVKELRDKLTKNKTNQKKMLEIQQQMMSKNMEMMKQSFKPMLFTFIPLIIIFAWMASTLAFMPLVPSEPFTITAVMTETFISGNSNISIKIVPEMSVVRDDTYVPEKAGTKEARWIATPEKEGTYSILIESPTFKETKEIIISTEKKYSMPVSDYKESQLDKLIVGNKEVKPFGSFSLLGWRPGWLGTYIILSIVMSIGLRKLLDIS